MGVISDYLDDPETRRARNRLPSMLGGGKQPPNALPPMLRDGGMPPSPNRPPPMLSAYVPPSPIETIPATVGPPAPRGVLPLSREAAAYIGPTGRPPPAAGGIPPVAPPVAAGAAPVLGPKPKLIANSKLGKLGQAGGVAQAGLGALSLYNNGLNATGVDNLTQGAAMAINPGVGAIGNVLTQGRNLVMDQVISNLYRDRTAGPALKAALAGRTPEEYIAARQAPSATAAAPMPAVAPTAMAPPAPSATAYPPQIPDNAPQLPAFAPIRAPAPVTSIRTSYGQPGDSALGNMYGASAALGGINLMNAQNKRALGNSVTASDANIRQQQAALAAQKAPGELAKTQGEIAKLAADNKRQQRVDDLQQRLIGEDLPDKEREKLMTQLQTLLGKDKAPQYDLMHAKGGLDPSDPMGVRTLPDTIIRYDKSTGKHEYLSGGPSGTGAAALPPGMKRQVGTSGGKPVYEDEQGKRFLGK